MSLLGNAVGAIQIAIEDFHSNDERRVLAAIRNLHAGILLLCKVKLQRLSPADSDEVLLKQSIRPHPSPDGSITWVGAGTKTADQQAIKERFGALKIPLDWRRLEAVSQIRNTAEHYYFAGTRQQAQEAFAEGCILIRQLVMDILDEDPAALIGEDAWTALYENRLIFDRELQACQATLKPLVWLDGAADVPENIQCPNCGSKLVRQLDEINPDPHSASFRCTACGQTADVETLVLHVLDEVYGADAYIAAKDGGDPPVEDCPECGLESYVVERGACALCEFSVPKGADCAICGEPLTAHDYAENGGLCGYHAHVAERERDR
jgi:hypothetical protein